MPPKHTVTILHEVADPADDNVDVVVSLPTGERYGATFFTTANIDSLLRKWEGSGECGGGLYFWSTHPIVVRELNEDTIRKVVGCMFEDGEFHSAFERLDSPPE